MIMSVINYTKKDLTV